MPDFIHADVEGQNLQIGPPTVNYSDTGLTLGDRRMKGPDADAHRIKSKG